VGLTPELLPMVISVTLSRGAMRMARQRVIVKRLASIESHHLAVCRGNRPDIAAFCVGARLPI
jgi:hypothetical protein